MAAFDKGELLEVGYRGPKTHIDRRQCSRVVPMKLLCLGMARTGTSSLRVALMILGFSEVYHMVSLLKENPLDDTLWQEAYAAKFDGIGKLYGREEFDKLLGHCMAVTDLPCVDFADDLVVAYPAAKVILTVRDSPKVWHTSVVTTLWTGRYILGPPTSWLQALVQRLMWRPQAWRTLRNIYRHQMSDDFPTNGIRHYEKHNQHVRNLVKDPDLFLEFNVKEGWGPLCAFLDVPVPDVEFPRVNDGKAWRKFVTITKRRVLGKAILVLGKGVLAVAVGGLAIYLGKSYF